MAAFYDNGVKVSYCDFLGKPDNYRRFPLLHQAVHNVREKLSIDVVNQIVDNTPALSDIRREFYRMMISERYEKILMPAFCVIEDFTETANP